VKATQFVRGVVLVASLALTAATGASAAPPTQSVTCVVGGMTSFTHPPKGTDNVTFEYYTLTALAGTSAWAGGQRRTPTPGWVTGDHYVMATFFNGSTELGQAEQSCS
jgi:hypothetical protein